MRPRGVPVLPGPGHAAPAARELGRRNAPAPGLPRPRRRDQQDLVTAIGAAAGARAPAALRRALERLVALGAQRDRFVAWEYDFSFGGGTPPWISGMTQGTAVQALARATRVSRSAPPLSAHRGARAGRLPRAAAGRRRASPCQAAATTSCTPSRPACGSSTATCRRSPGCATSPVLGRSRAARVLYRRGERAARAAVRGFDTGAWSLYSEAGASPRSATTSSSGASSATSAAAPAGAPTARPSGASPATSASRRGSASRA